MPFCANCGNELDDTDQFCGTCGTAIESVETPGQQEKSSGDHKEKLAYYIFLAILALIWLAMGMPTDRFWWR